MKPVVSVPDLLDKLEENRSRHRRVFEAALDGWRKRAMAQVKRISDELEAGRYPELHTRLPLPEDHTRDYDRAIVMVQMHQGTTIELSETDAAHYIQDDWEWKRQWLGATSGYAAATVEEVYGDGELSW